VRRQDQWLELADRLGMSRLRVVSCMAFLNLRRPASWISKELRIPEHEVYLIASRGKPLLRKPDGPRSFPKHRMKRSALECVYCGSQSDLTRDHVIPVSRGGSNDPSNIVVACRTCNCTKGDRTPEEWLHAG
jgi:5-methylcytosine-specific restriction endonuclease McrA